MEATAAAELPATTAEAEPRVTLYSAFGLAFGSAADTASRLGIDVEPRGVLASVTSTVPASAIGRIRAEWDECAAEAVLARKITPDHVSCRFVDRHLRFSSAHFARVLGLEVKRPDEGESEEFIRIEDLDKIAAQARASAIDGTTWRTSQAHVDHCLGLVAHHNAAGVTARELARRGVPVL